MTDLASNPSYLQIRNQLAAVRQKYRAQKLLAGVIRWATWSIAATIAAAFAAHFLHEGKITVALTFIWWSWIWLSVAIWIVIPQMRRSSDVQVARMVESRIDGLDNGLTNSLLLARAPDLQNSPFLLPIFEEVLRATAKKPLDRAISLHDLKPAAKKLLAVSISALVLAIAFHDPLVQGWRQMLTPARFIPQIGTIEITDIQPGSITLVAGQPLEISAMARDSANPAAMAPQGKLIFDNSLGQAELVGSVDGGQFRYAYRFDHVEQSMRYRVEVGSTQSAWFDVNVVPEVKLTELDFQIQPPAYTHQSATTLKLPAEKFGKIPIVMPQGSVVQIGATVDVPASGATVQFGDSHSIQMTADEDHRHFHNTITVMNDTPIGLQLYESEQMVAKSPAGALAIRCQIDSPPQIEMTWPNTESVMIAPASEPVIEAVVRDDWGLDSVKVLLTVGDAPQMTAFAVTAPINSTVYNLKAPIHLTAEQLATGQSIHVQVQAVDNRDLRQQMKGMATAGSDDGGPQTSRGPLLEIQFADPTHLSELRQQSADKLLARLTQMLSAQQSLLDRTVAAGSDKDVIAKILAGQTDLKNLLSETAEKFQFDEQTLFIKRTLQVLVVNPAKDAIDLCNAIIAEPAEDSRKQFNRQLRATQQHVISTLESLIAMLRPSNAPSAQPGAGSEPLASHPDAIRNLDEKLKQFVKQQQKVLKQTAPLAKKSVDDYTVDDKKLIEDLRLSQENLDAFVQQAVSDFSRNGPQDMTNSDVAKDLVAVQSEVTMAKNALADKSPQIAVAAEDTGVSDAIQASKDLEKWLPNSPGGSAMAQEDLTDNAKTPPTPPLPKDMEDMVGKLMQQEEDLLQQVQDANANMQMPVQQQGWSAGDGPIADNSGKAVTGNQLPSNNQEAGRAGEGRSAQSEGQFVGDSAVGKGGRDTPTRLDPTPFEKGQVHDTSRDPVGGATGGGKLSGQGGQGLEGPLPARVQQQLQRLAQRQAELRNVAQKLNLKYRLARYDNFKLEQSIDQMAGVESDLRANRYQNALLRRDVLIDALASSKMLLGGQLHVQLDTSPAPSGRTQLDINDAMAGQLPPAWAQPLKEYYRKLSQQ